MTDQPTPRPWPDGTIPTAAQLLAWVRAATDDEVLLLLDGALASSEVAHRCMTHDHDHGMRELAARTADATRWAILRDHYRQLTTPTHDSDLVDRAIELLERDDTP